MISELIQQNLLRYISSKSIFSDFIVLKMYRKHMNRFLAVYWKEDFVSTKWHSFEIHYCPAIVLGIQFIYFNKVFTNQQLSLFSGNSPLWLFQLYVNVKNQHIVTIEICVKDSFRLEMHKHWIINHCTKISINHYKSLSIWK